MTITFYAKEKLKEVLWRVGLRETLPAGAINRVQIFENGEKLVNLRGDDSFFFGDDLVGQNRVLLREKVYTKLKDVQRLLPNGYYLKIFSAYRSMEEQQSRWECKLADNRQRYPEMSDEDVERLTRGQIADPRNGGFGGHQTGGAVDLTLCDVNGEEYDMGTTYDENSEKIRTSSSKVTLIQRRHREILKMCMEKAGFKNYPHEWWHYCYGDRMWGAYSFKKQCMYGMVNDDGKR